MIDFDSEISPFFQVIIKTCDAKFDTKLFTTAFKKKLADKNRLSQSHFFSVVQEDVQVNFIAFHLIHKSLPTWFSREPKAISKTEKIAEIENLENDILLIYLSQSHVFFHSNCKQVLTLITETIDVLIENQNWVLNNLSAEILMVILKQLELEFKTLGILNVFNAGGIAPEAKAYFGRNTADNLTPSFDSGFGFSYGLGSRIDKDNNKKPFGCSLSKSKIWGTWVDDLDDFLEKCEEILKWIKAKKTAGVDSLEVLISPTSKKSLSKAEPFEFYMDYFVMNKGIVGLTGKSATLDWDCHINPKDNTKLTFNLRYPASTESFDIVFAFDGVSEKIIFTYADPKSTLRTFCQGFEDDEQKEQDLVKYLNKQKNFTVIYNGGFAYRNGECWIDNRLKQTFKQTFDFIDWKDVDIKKEDKKPVGKRYNILEKVNVYFQTQPDKVLTINDNGANEVGEGSRSHL